MIGIIDYGMGNLHSVRKAFDKVGAETEIITTAAQIDAARKVVLPGVGAFRDAIGTLKDRGLVDPILESIRQGKPFLGICLGLQLLFETSYEDVQWQGLGLFRGDVRRFDFTGRADENTLKIPHMGWNELVWSRPAPLLRDLPERPHVYFVHSYYVAPADRDIIATTTDYGGEFVSSVWKDNVSAVQFHPEKSQQVGLAMLANFHRLKS
jgi:imidazole glycerol-phosphate synthase subunit HisH